MSNLSKAQIKILSIVNRKGGKISNFTLFKQVKIPLSDFMFSIFALRDRNFIEIDGEIIKILDDGLFCLYKIRPSKKSDPYFLIPDRMRKNNKITIYDFYVPSLKRLDKRLF
ncbi:hypothetical protein [Chromobacterium violaceum]|uniref:hypothetical protein n=1 Tax=Chromobacterium violaceum TaxID=536 RepID=UPI00111C190B|nr:hypothetical protein [Chromobacterium violaceum]